MKRGKGSCSESYNFLQGSIVDYTKKIGKIGSDKRYRKCRTLKDKHIVFFFHFFLSGLLGEGDEKGKKGKFEHFSQNEKLNEPGSGRFVR